MQGLVVLDSSFSLSDLRARGMMRWITARDLNGFIDEVWTVNPTSDTASVGSPRVTRVAARHTCIEGVPNRFRILRRAPALNYAASLVALLRRLSQETRGSHIVAYVALDPLMNGLLALALSKWNRRSSIVWVRGNHDRIYRDTGQPLSPRFFRSAGIEKLIQRFLLRHATVVMCLTEDYRDFAISYGANPERTHVVTFARDVEDIHFMEQAPKSPLNLNDALDCSTAAGPLRLALVSRLNRVKYVQDIVPLVAELEARSIDFRLDIFGDGPERGQLEYDLEGARLNQRVFFHGIASQEELREALNCTDVYISLLSGSALAEAALAGCAVVAYAVDWHGELIDDGSTGRLVESRNAIALATAIEDLANSRETAKEMGQNLRTAALELLDRDRALAVERSVLEQLARPDRRPRLHRFASRYLSSLAPWRETAHPGSRQTRPQRTPL